MSDQAVYQSVVKFTDNIYTLDAPQNFKGVDMGTRMTIVRLPNDTLWLHSPVPISAEVKAQIDSLGKVAYIVAPNKMHHLYLDTMIDHYPAAQIYLAPDLATKLEKLNRKVAKATELTNASPTKWQAVFEQHHIPSMPMFEEVVFLHKPSKTLIVTDAVYDLSQSKRWYLKPIINLMNYKTPKGLFAEKKIIPLQRHDETVIASLRTIAKWDFDNLIMAHGQTFLGNGKAIFLAAYEGYAHLKHTTD